MVASTTPTTRTIKEVREQLARQFEIESIRLGYVVEQRLTNFRYLVTDSMSGKRYKAVVLPTSFDFYEFRLNSGKARFDLLIVEKHNAAVPVRVLSLTLVTSYEPLVVPCIERSNRQRRSREEMQLLLSKLLLNFESAWDEVEHMSHRHRQRFLQLRDDYLKPRIGRPWAS